MSHDNENKKCECNCMPCDDANHGVDGVSHCKNSTCSTPPSEVSIEDKLREIVYRNWKLGDEVSLYTESRDLLKSVREEAKRETVKQLLEYYYKQRQYKDSPVDVVIEEFCEIEQITLK